MKTAAVISALALALPAFAAPAATSASATPTATPQDPCQTKYNQCLAQGTVEVACSCDLTTCVGEDSARIREYCASQTSGLKRAATPTSAPSSTSSSASTAPTGAYVGLAIRSGSVIQYASVNAAESSFWLYKNTTVYCPEVAGIGCSNTTITQFAGGDETLDLHVVVPGGQQVYVAADGHLGYTVPHSAYTGEGSSTTGFSVVDNGLHLEYQGNGFLACPEGSSYKVYASAAATNASADCLGFEFRISDSSAPAAFEYF